MIWRLLLSFLGVWWVINAFQMFACGSVSFGGTRRAVQWACYEGSGFGVPGPVAGLGILLVVAGVLYWMWRPLWSGPPARSTPTRMGQMAEQTPKSEPRPARRPVSSAATGDIPPRRKTDMNDPISEIWSMTSEEDLEARSKSEDWTIRRAVAQNPHTSPEVMATLSVDDVAGVRKAVASALTAPEEVLQDIADGDPVMVVRGLAEDSLQRQSEVEAVEDEASEPAANRSVGVSPSPEVAIEKAVEPDLAIVELRGKTSMLEALSTSGDLPMDAVRRQCLVLLRQINQLHNDDRLTTEEFRELNTRLLDLTKV